MSADSPRRSSGSRGIAVAATVPPQVVSDRSILDSAIGFINDVTLAHQPHTEPKDTITWARFETAADISDPRYGDDWEMEGNVAPPLLLILGYGLGVQVWAIPANGEAVEVLSWRHGVVSALRVLPTPATVPTIEEHGRADERADAFADKRPLIALVDGSTTAGAQPQFCAVNFVSLKVGTQVKAIKFKNPVLDVLANRSSVVITFHERIAVFDARTLDDRLSVTTCYPSPGVNPNPVALGQRWMAYAENRLIHTKRSAAGCDGDGVASYTATMLNAAKSLGKGLRELGEHVAAGLTGTTGSVGSSKNSSFEAGCGPDTKQPGIVTILDIKHTVKDYSPTAGTPVSGQGGNDPVVAHFIAHSEAIVAMEFDNSGMLLLTADRRGHDFHIFRIQPHPVGSVLAAVHHLYVLHRGDTSAKVQNIAFSLDTRWVAVSTLRGTTHVFPITPYGGAMGVRTHTSLHVVNKLSRFHRSAGLSADGRSSSPISHSESTTFVQSLQPYHNPTLPPFPRPTVVLPLAQLRQPLALGSPPGSAGLTIGAGGKAVAGGGANSAQRQRLSSLSDDNGKPLSVCAIFAKSRSWLLEPPNVTREAPHRVQRKAVDSLFVMAGHGALIQYDLDTKLASNVAKEKICDETPIELEVEAKAQWNVGRRKDGSQELTPPLYLDNWLIRDRNSCMLSDSTRQYDDTDDRAESWLSQVEIITHAGPHRRLWMGPQFVFKTYNTPSGSNLNHVDAEAVEIGVAKASTASAAAAAVAAVTRVERSSPLNMPLSAAARAAVPVLIESGSYSSIEQSPKLMDRFRHDHLDSDFAVSHGDTRLKEDLADAMRESPSVSAAAQHKEAGRPLLSSAAASSTDNIPFYDALTEHDHDDDNDDEINDDDDDDDDHYHEDHKKSDYNDHQLMPRPSSVAVLASALPNIYSYETNSSYESLDSLKHKQQPNVSIEKVVNPLGTVTTVTGGATAARKQDMLDEMATQLAAEDCVIHENCDEALFRPVVAIFCDENMKRAGSEEARRQKELCQPPEVIGNKLVVPVIAKEVDDELSRKEKEKSDNKGKQQQQQRQKEQSKFAEMSSFNKRQEKVNVLVPPPRQAPRKLSREEIGRELICEIAPPPRPEKKGQMKSATTTKKAAEPVVDLADEAPIEFKRMTPEPKPRTSEKMFATTATKNEQSLSKAAVREKTPQQVVPSREGTPQKQVSLKDNTSKDDETERAIKEDMRKAKSPASSKSLEQKKNKDDREDGTQVKPEKISTRTAVNQKGTKTEQHTAAVEPPTAKLIKSTTSESKQKPQVAVSSTKEASVKMELLNVSSLADSLIELKDDEERDAEVDDDLIMVEVTKDESIEEKKPALREQGKHLKDHDSQVPLTVKETGLVKEDESTVPKSEDQRIEKPVEVFATIPPQPTKASKKKKQKQSRSASSSEGEEVVEVTLTLGPQNRRRSIEDQKKPERKSSFSSDEGIYPDKVENLLVDKSKQESAMSISFAKTEEKKTVKLTGSEKKTSSKPIEIVEKKEDMKGKQDVKSNQVTMLESEAKVTMATILMEKDKQDAQKPKPTPEVKEQPAKNIGKEETAIAKKLEENLEKSSKRVDDKATFKVDVQPKLEETKKDLKVGAVKVKKGEAKTMDMTTATLVKPPSTTQDDASERKKSLSEISKAHEKERVVDTKVETPKSPKKMTGKTETETAITANIALSKKAPEIKLEPKKNTQIETLPAKKKENLTLETSNSIKPTKIHATEPMEERPAKKERDTTGSPTKTSKTSPTLIDWKLKEKAVAPTPTPATPAPFVWDVLSGAELISKNLESAKAVIQEEYPSLGQAGKNKKLAEPNSPIKSTKINATETVQDKLAKKGVDITDGPTKRIKTSPIWSDSAPKENVVPPVPILAPPAWKMCSGAEMISKNLESAKAAVVVEDYPSLRKMTKIKKVPGKIGLSDFSSDKLLPELPTPPKALDEFKEPLVLGRGGASQKVIRDIPNHFKDFPILKPLEALPPLPALEPFESLMALRRSERESHSEQMSLINFESPLQENPALERKITPPPRGFTEQNLILALCGSLHYENEQNKADRLDTSPTLSITRSNSGLGEYKSFTENDEPYMSLEQSSQDTNTTNTATTNEKLSSSEAEDLIIMEEKKMTKKQRRKKQQMEFEKQKEKAISSADVDEELRPLIGMSDSQLDSYVDSIVSTEVPTSTTLLMHDSYNDLKATKAQFGNSTTTDSEGPMPATTSDDNVIILPSSSKTLAPHKLKTKKLEHKINLIGAIEAATSSSTSSAEESGVDAGPRSPNALDGDGDITGNAALVSVAATPVLQLPLPLPHQMSAKQHGGTKKKMKRRMR